MELCFLTSIKRGGKSALNPGCSEWKDLRRQQIRRGVAEQEDPNSGVLSKSKSNRQSRLEFKDVRKTVGLSHLSVERTEFSFKDKQCILIHC
jgi:hypothetical protein